MSKAEQGNKGGNDAGALNHDSRDTKPEQANQTGQQSPASHTDRDVKTGTREEPSHNDKA